MVLYRHRPRHALLSEAGSQRPVGLERAVQPRPPLEKCHAPSLQVLSPRASILEQQGHLSALLTPEIKQHI